LGVDAIAAIPPIYFRLPDAAIAKYWNDISDAADQTDFVIYNIPQLAGVALSEGLYRKMLENPRVIGVKNSSMPVQDIQIFKAVDPENTVVFNGPDEQYISGRTMGADGGIGGTYGVMPDLFLKLEELVNKGDLETARNLQYDINQIIYTLCSGKGCMYAVIKGVLNENEGIDLGGVRAPFANLEPEDDAVIKKAADMINAARSKYL
jgi:N-acetylneuraminate lyase